jgi:hypothetical protein
LNFNYAPGSRYAGDVLSRRAADLHELSICGVAEGSPCSAHSKPGPLRDEFNPLALSYYPGRTQHVLAQRLAGAKTHGELFADRMRRIDDRAGGKTCEVAAHYA